MGWINADGVVLTKEECAALLDSYNEGVVETGHDAVTLPTEADTPLASAIFKLFYGADRVKVEPLPCPFCGAKPKVWESDTSGRWAVVCETANCLMRAALNGWRNTRAEALAAWNKRA